MNNDMLLSNKMQLLEIYYLITKDIRCYISIDTNIKAKKIIKDIIKMF
jgi:hypothetical protein